MAATCGTCRGKWGRPALAVPVPRDRRGRPQRDSGETRALPSPNRSRETASADPRTRRGWKRRTVSIGTVRAPPDSCPAGASATDGARQSDPRLRSGRPASFRGRRHRHATARGTRRGYAACRPDHRAARFFPFALGDGRIACPPARTCACARGGAGPQPALRNNSRNRVVGSSRGPCRRPS